MKYFVQCEEVNKEEFDIAFEKALESYKPISEYGPQTKEEMYEKLKQEREVSFMIRGTWRYFLAVEEEIYDMAQVVEEAEFDALDGDSVAIAVALYNAGYKKVK